MPQTATYGKGPLRVRTLNLRSGPLITMRARRSSVGAILKETIQSQ